MARCPCRGKDATRSVYSHSRRFNQQWRPVGPVKEEQVWKCCAPLTRKFREHVDLGLIYDCRLIALNRAVSVCEDDADAPLRMAGIGRRTEKNIVIAGRRGSNGRGGLDPPWHQAMITPAGQDSRLE